MYMLMWIKLASTSSRSPLLYSFIFTIAVVITTCSATDFQVGDTLGWRIPATNESQLYNNDSVTVVEKWGFYHCDSSNPIAFFNDGDTVIDLDNVGTMYFISGESDRCKQGVLFACYFCSAGGFFSDVAPSPTQVMSSGDELEASPGTDSLDSVSVSGIAVVLGVCCFEYVCFLVYDALDLKIWFS
ncbi:putative Phytocyanin domain, cupredoxin [Helianthus anomalus]